MGYLPNTQDTRYIETPGLSSIKNVKTTQQREKSLCIPRS